MRLAATFGLVLLVPLTAVCAGGCILRPGMNAACTWPSEPPTALHLTDAADRRHLRIDTELVEELVDRYRFHPPDAQRECERRLIATRYLAVLDCGSAAALCCAWTETKERCEFAILV